MHSFQPEAPEAGDKKALCFTPETEEDAQLVGVLLGAMARYLPKDDGGTRSPAAQKVLDELAGLLVVVREEKAEGGVAAVLRSPRVREGAAEVLFALGQLFESQR
jgi:hypothetical protein